MVETKYFLVFANWTALLLEGVNVLIALGLIMTAYLCSYHTNVGEYD